eukprot:12799167-Alexandrium_andersonii.AAC.1
MNALAKRWAPASTKATILTSQPHAMHQSWNILNMLPLAPCVASYHRRALASTFRAKSFSASATAYLLTDASTICAVAVCPACPRFRFAASRYLPRVDSLWKVDVLRLRGFVLTNCAL